MSTTGSYASITAIEPWLTVPDVREASDFYLNAFGAVEDPDALFERAVGAGAAAMAPVHDEHGWRTGRLTDPFGHDWEVSKRR
jgi:predicted lactoylglutathione lyase